MKNGLKWLYKQFMNFCKSYKEWGFGGMIKYPWAFRRGFTKEEVRLYAITKKNHPDYIRRREEDVLLPFNVPYQGACSDKLGLIRILHEHTGLMPKYFFYIDQFGLLPLWDHPKRGQLPYRAGADALLDLLDNVGTVIAKPTHSAVGAGVMLIQKKGDSYFVNNSRVKVNALKRRITSAVNFIVTECVVNNAWTRNIYSGSLNTIRMLGIWNSDKREFDIIRSFHRFGCNGNVVDNVGSGNGICVFINPKTGIMTEDGAVNLEHGGEISIKNPVHPNSDIALSGLKIPGYLEMKEKVLQILNENSYLRYVGLDIAMTEDGFRIIEANGRSDFGQNVGGFWKDKRMAELFRGYR